MLFSLLGKAMSETVVERVFQFEKLMKFCQANEDLRDSRLLRQFLTGSVCLIEIE
jgi:hypothetical protein